MTNLLNGWNFMRIIRLIFGAGALVQGIPAQNNILIAIGALLLLQGIFNMGCCGPAGCATRPAVKKGDATKEVEFEEVQGK